MVRSIKVKVEDKKIDKEEKSKNEKKLNDILLKDLLNAKEIISNDPGLRLMIAGIRVNTDTNQITKIKVKSSNYHSEAGYHSRRYKLRK